jgi:hypothetical protein
VSAPLGYEALRELARELGRPQHTLTVVAAPLSPGDGFDCRPI